MSDVDKRKLQLTREQSLRALPVLAADAAATPATVSRKRPASRAAAPKKKPRAG